MADSSTKLNKKTRSLTKKNPNSQPSPLVLLFLSLIIGFFGGALSVRLYEQENTSPNSSQSSQQVILTESEAISDVAKKVSPSVVSITVETTTPDSFFFRGFTQEGSGTGIIISSDGLILTNKHVIPTGVQKVTVLAQDGTQYTDVKVIGRDPFNDIAFIKINNVSGLPAATLGDSSQVKVGDKAIAIGNALGQFENTVTAGIISGISRPVVAGSGFSSESLQNLLQTDAAINPGNSGGPLVNIKGEVIGVNTAIAGGAENIGFAIPINDIKSDIASVKNNNRLVKPYLGVRYISVNSQVQKQFDLPVDYGAYIVEDSTAGNSIIPDSPADKAGLKAGDIILEIDNTKIDEHSSLVGLVGQHQVGENITLKVQRGDKTIDVTVTLEEAPDSLQ